MVWRERFGGRSMTGYSTARIKFGLALASVRLDLEMRVLFDREPPTCGSFCIFTGRFLPCSVSLREMLSTFEE
jgi:hypothetical protein